MRLPILLFFIFIPILEISVFMEIGGRIGSFNTIFIVLLTTVAGISLMRSQGLLILQKAQERFILNRFPVEVIFDGLCVFVAGMLLLIPGFVTDFIGFLVFFPPTRLLLKIFSIQFLKKWGHTFAVQNTPLKTGTKDIIDVDFKDVTKNHNNALRKE